MTTTFSRAELLIISHQGPAVIPQSPDPEHTDAQTVSTHTGKVHLWAEIYKGNYILCCPKVRKKTHQRRFSSKRAKTVCVCKGGRGQIKQKDRVWGVFNVCNCVKVYFYHRRRIAEQPGLRLLRVLSEGIKLTLLLSAYGTCSNMVCFQREIYPPPTSPALKKRAPLSLS